MNFSQLKYIVAVDKHRNFSRASEELGVAQSTLSKEIQRLEKEFGILIFDRSRFPVKPTMKGKDLIRQAEKILQEQRNFIEIARQMINRPAGEFKLGILPMLAPYLLPLFIHSLSQKYPELKVEILELPASDMVIRLESGDLDGAVALRPFIKEGFYMKDLFEEEFVLYLNAEHALAQKEEVNWEDIPVNELILHEAFEDYILGSEMGMDKETFPIKHLGNVNYLSGSLETIRKIIDRNGGITLLPKLACMYMGERRLKMVRPIVNPRLKRMIAIVTPRGFEKNRITKVIREEIVKGVKNNP